MEKDVKAVNSIRLVKIIIRLMKEMACIKKRVLTQFFNSTKYSGAPDVGLPFGCPTVNYQVHAKAQEGLVCPK